VGSDAHGMKVDELEEVLAREAPRLIYLVPSFQNPQGTTLSLERRRALVALAQKYEVPILEDEPYAELRFRGETLPSLASLDDQGLVVSLGTFSKTLAPGLRLGWLRASPALMRPAVIAKQSSDLHCSSLSQRAVVALFEQGFDYDSHLGRIRAVYGERCEAMQASLTKHVPSARFNSPDGGLFLWLELEGFDAQAMLPKAVERKFAYVPGAPFFVHDARPGALRLNFSNRTPELIDEGMRRLGALVTS
jgi:2-aminoadipate transaminase